MPSRKQSIAILLCTLSLCSSVQAQDVADLFGTWSVAATAPPGDENCGQKYLGGELRVLQRISQEELVLYMGVITVETKFEHCEHVTSEKSRAYIAVRGNRVDISYENSNWSPDFLVRTGDVMEGPDAAGVVGHWIRQSGPSDSARAAEAKKNIAQAAYEQFSDRIREALLSQLNPVSSIVGEDQLVEIAAKSEPSISF